MQTELMAPDAQTAMESTRSINQVREQVVLIQQLMREVMKDGEHFGTVPGCGDKKVLLKSGAEKLSMVFRLKPRFELTLREFQNGHREYEIRCVLSDGTEGVGCCNTMEGKYRYRSENTGREVPSEYWKSRDKSLLGGTEFSPKKNDGKWFIMHRVEHDNPADYYNTCLKMAKKRAHVDAIITATASSDIFTQDLEENQPVTSGEAPKPLQQPARKSAPAESTPAQPTQQAAPTQPKQQPAANPDTGELSLTIREVPSVGAPKTGTKKNGQPWKKWSYKSAAAQCWLGTFSESIGALLEEATESGKPLEITYETTQNGGDIIQAKWAE
jgi:hypothetical protein